MLSAVLVLARPASHCEVQPALELGRLLTTSVPFVFLSLLQVLRYSALALGVFYGFYHQTSLTSSQKVAAAKREYQHKQSLIEKAKAEYSKSKQPPAPASSSGGRKSHVFLVAVLPSPSPRIICQMSKQS